MKIKAKSSDNFFPELGISISNYNDNPIELNMQSDISVQLMTDEEMQAEKIKLLTFLDQNEYMYEEIAHNRIIIIPRRMKKHE